MPEHIALDKVESALHGLIEAMRDGQEEFRELGQRLEDERTKRFFLEQTQLRAEYAAELENELHRMGVHDVNVKISRSGKARLLWGEIQAAMAGEQKALLSTAEKSDARALEAYAQALREDLPLPLRESLERQRVRIQRSHDEIRALYDLR